MTNLLEKTLNRASSFSREDQDMLAGILLEEILAEERWNTMLKQSADSLGMLADQALADFNSGFTEILTAGKL